MTQIQKLMNDLEKEALRNVRNSAPVKTGNLRDSVYSVRIGNMILIRINTGKAPYAPYTIEEWTNPRWNGKTNPNQYWDRRGSQNFINYAKAKLKAKIIKQGVVNNGKDA